MPWPDPNPGRPLHLRPGIPPLVWQPCPAHPEPGWGEYVVRHAGVNPCSMGRCCAIALPSGSFQHILGMGHCTGCRCSGCRPCRRQCTSLFMPLGMPGVEITLLRVDRQSLYGRDTPCPVCGDLRPRGPGQVRVRTVAGPETGTRPARTGWDTADMIAHFIPLPVGSPPTTCRGQRRTRRQRARHSSASPASARSVPCRSGTRHLPAMY